MSTHFLSHKSSLNSIIKNPGETVEELQNNVRILAATMDDVIRFLDSDLAGRILRDLKYKEKRRS